MDHSADQPVSCERCDAPWDGEQCSSSDCFCTLCPFCGQQWAEASEPCDHLVALFSEGENQLEWLDRLPALPRELDDAEVHEVFGDDADFARAVWAEGFTERPVMGDVERMMLRDYPGSHFIVGYFDGDWIGDGDWAVVYVPDRSVWHQQRDAGLQRVRCGVESL